MTVLSITPQLIIEECKKRGLACAPLESVSPKVYLELTDQSGKRHYIQGAVTDKSSGAAARIADDKLATAAIAKRLGLPVPETVVYGSDEHAEAFLKQYKPIVVKPLDSGHGNGVSMDVMTMEQLLEAVRVAQTHSTTVLLQQQVDGRDLRLLYINGELCAAAERKPACVTGDGQHTLQELISITNEHPDRGESYKAKYGKISLDLARKHLGDQLQEVPRDGEEVRVVGPANIGCGGTAIDRTEEISPELVDYGRRLAQELRMGVCGVDFLDGPDGSYLIEINASPSFGLHHLPHEGKPRDVAAAFVDWLLADDVH